MRRLAPVLFALTLVALGVPAAGATVVPSAATPCGTAMGAFCRSTDRFVRFLAHAPDPRKLATAKGRRVLRAFHDDAPTDVAAATGTVVGSFGYLSRHGLHTLTKARDTATADALLRAALFASTHCPQPTIRRLAQGLVQRRMAQAETANPSSGGTTPTTVAR